MIQMERLHGISSFHGLIGESIPYPGLGACPDPLIKSEGMLDRGIHTLSWIGSLPRT